MPQSYSHRPPRLATVFSDLPPLFFITFNTHRRQPWLANDDLHNCWRTFAQQAPEHGAWVGRYVLMPDHAHLFVWLAPDKALSAWVQSLKAVLGKELHRQGHERPHWQAGFFDHLLRSDESYGDKWEYVRQNPVRKGLCARPEDWPYQGEITPLERV